MKGDEPPLKISSPCKDTPWFDALMSLAVERQDIALLYNVTESGLEHLREYGITTIQQAANMQPRDMPHIKGIGEENLERIQMQAQSLIDNKVVWRQLVEIPMGKMRIYFDIEGDPFLKLDYLYGFWIEGDGKKEPYFKYFLAEAPEAEEKMWREFVAWMETIKDRDYKVYHYAPYERSSIKKMMKRYGESSTIEDMLENFVDLAKVVKHTVIFPIYFYSIKDIAKSDFLGYKWRHPEASGANSIFWYEKWLETGDRARLQDIVDYNEDDVIATKVLHEWLIDNSPQT